MNRDQLRVLPVDALIEVILALQARVAELEALAARVAQLEAELASAHQPTKTPANSSVPPSQGRKANRAERRGRKSGARRGHLGSSRLRQTPDQVIKVRPTACGGCGAELGPRDQRRVGRSQVIELPPIQPIVIEVWRYAAVCPDCHHRTVAEAPAGLESARTFGSGIETRLGYLHERHHLSYARLVEVFQELFGLKLSEGAIANALARLAAQGRPTYETIREEIRGSPVIESDETGARVQGRSWYEWYVGTRTASFHTIVPTRAAQVLDEFLDGATPEVWVSDLYAGQVRTPAGAHQICLAHQLRDLEYAIETDAVAGRVWAVALRRQFRLGIRLHHQRATLTPDQFAYRRTRLVQATARLLHQAWVGPAAAAKLQRRYQRHEASLFVFLERDDVEPTNNSSERALRNSVIHRKVTGGFRSAWGAEASAILTSILGTARKRGQSYLAALRVVAGPSSLHAANMGS
jgi:transposase